MTDSAEWRTKRFGEVAEILSGKYLAADRYDPSGPYTIYGSNSIMGKAAAPLYDGPVIAFARIGSNCGATMFSPAPCWINNNAAGVRGRTGTDTRFLYYWMQNFDFEVIREGTGQPYISNATLEAQVVELPPLPEQRRIARILGALDDKIELNRRTNETLEAVARALFRAWFVDFEPVRAKQDGRPLDPLSQKHLHLFPDRLVDTEHGEIPEGWEWGVLGEIVTIHDSKRIPLSGRERESRNGPYPYYGAAAKMDSVDGYLFDGVHILLGEDGSVVNDDGTPVLQYVWDKFWVNNHAHVLTAKPPFSEEMLLQVLRQANVEALVTGAVQPKISQGNLCRLPVLIPGAQVSAAYAATLAPLYARVRMTAEETRVLAETRDALLPRLLSGDVRTSNEEWCPC